MSTYSKTFDEWWTSVFAPVGKPDLAKPEKLVDEYDLVLADRAEVEGFVEECERQAYLEGIRTDFPEAYHLLAVERLLKAIAKAYEDFDPTPRGWTDLPNGDRVWRQ